MNVRRIVVDPILVILFLLLIVNRAIGLFQFYSKLETDQGIYFWVMPILVLMGLTFLMYKTIMGSGLFSRILQLILFVFGLSRIWTLALVPPSDEIGLLMAIILVVLYMITAIYIHVRMRKDNASAR